MGKKQEILIMVGLPASGKDTFVADIINEKVVCPDTIRKEMFGVQFDSRKEPEVWDEAYRQLNEYLKAGESVVFNATNLTKERRRRIIRRVIRESGSREIRIMAYVCTTDFDTCLKRNRERPNGERVPDRVIFQMATKYEEPTLDEGFDYILFDNDKAYIKDVNEFMELLALGR